MSDPPTRLRSKAEQRGRQRQDKTMASQVCGLRVRWYPSAKQQAVFAREAGAARWVWNQGIEMISKAYERRKESRSYIDISRWLTQFKRTSRGAWLQQASSNALNQSLRDLDEAFRHFFRRVRNGEKPGYPRFKSRKQAEQSVTYALDARSSGQVQAWERGHFRLTHYGTIRPRWTGNRPVTKPKMVTITRDACGDFWISAAVEIEIAPMPKTEGEVGIDLGLESLVAFSTGEKIEPPKPLQNSLRRLRHESRALSRKVKGSSRWQQQKERLARLNRKVANQRREWLHRLTTDLVRENQLIVIEDLAVRNMLHNRRLARSISDAAWGELRRQLGYKCEWYGRELVVVDRWLPSSKTCSKCGLIREEMPLSTRSWVCACGAEHDRDVNAARNILAAGRTGRRLPVVIAQRDEGSKRTRRSANLAMLAQTELRVPA